MTRARFDPATTSRVRPGLRDAAVHTKALAKQGRADDAWQRGACGYRMGEWYPVLVRDSLVDDQPLAGETIVRGREHFRGRPVRLTVAGEEPRDALDGWAVNAIVGRERRVADGADGGRIPILNAEIDLPRPFLAGVGAGDWSELPEQAREMAKEVELRPQAQEISGGHRRADIGSGGGADDHFGLFCRIDAELHEAVEETAIPGDVIFAAAAKHERPIKADGKIGFRRRIRDRPGKPVVAEQLLANREGQRLSVRAGRLCPRADGERGRGGQAGGHGEDVSSTCYPLRSEASFEWPPDQASGQYQKQESFAFSKDSCAL